MIQSQASSPLVGVKYCPWMDFLPLTSDEEDGFTD